MRSPRLLLLAALAAAPLTAHAACDVDSLMRSVSKSSLPARTARLIEAKIRYADRMRSAASIAPVKPADALRAAASLAAADPALSRALEESAQCVARSTELPARLILRMPDATTALFIIDGIPVRAKETTAFVEVGAGKHDITASAGDITASKTINAGEGDALSLDFRGDAKPVEPRYVLDPHLDRGCLSVYRTGDSQPIKITRIDGVTIDQRGTFDATTLFHAGDDGSLCASDVAALREILGDASAPAVIHVIARAENAPRIEATTRVNFGRTVTIRSAGAEHRVLEGPVTIADHKFEVHCDTEVAVSGEKASIVRGGCADAAGAMTSEVAAIADEEVQELELAIVEGALKPVARTIRRTEPLESATEDGISDVSGVGGMQIRAYAANDTVVFRTTANGSGGSVIIDLPLSARYVDIKGWTPETTARFDLLEFPKGGN